MSDATHNVIFMWSGAIADIPEGWKLCDGSNDTPDLRDKFIIGAGGSYNPDASGGSYGHTHDFTANYHNHGVAVGSAMLAGTGKNVNVSNELVSGTTDSADSVPPYYALAFIMKK